jgi:hypothetical protein
MFCGGVKRWACAGCGARAFIALHCACGGHSLCFITTSRRDIVFQGSAPRMPHVKTRECPLNRRGAGSSGVCLAFAHRIEHLLAQFAGGVSAVGGGRIRVGPAQVDGSCHEPLAVQARVGDNLAEGV